MGVVWRAVDTALDREVAVKVLPAALADHAERLARFEREAKLLAALNHPNVATIHGLHRVGDLRFLTMEYVDGKPLSAAIPAAGLPLPQLFDLGIQIADALAAAHERGITHRDLKPDNVMITGSGRLKVLDFGLAKRLDEPHEASFEGATLADRPRSDFERLTSDGMLIGTIPYMSPEHVRGAAIDGRSDLFSLGIILYEMLTGERPFKGSSPASLMAAILSHRPPPVSAARSDVPRHLELAIELCLEKDPAERLQSVQSLHEQLRILRRELSSGGASSDAALAARLAASSAREGSLGSRASRAIGRHRASLLILAGVFVVNLVETNLETAIRNRTGLGQELGIQLARAAHWFEGSVTLEGWDGASPLVVYGYSAAYFFLPLLLGMAVAWSLARRSQVRPFRHFADSVAVAYAVSLPFFLFFPVPERWAWPDSGAILLSDLWAPTLIEVFRPISGLDNCFPSFHVSLTTVVVGSCFVEHLRFRWAALCIGLLVIISTVVLGIHWLTDVVAGLATGVLALAGARLLDAHLRGPQSVAG